MMKRVMLVEDEEFILQGILCIVDWPSINMELAYTAHNGMEALEKAGKKLDDMDRKQAANMEEKIGWAQFLKITGGMKKEERKSFIQMLPEIPDSGKIFPALIKIDLESLDEEEGITPILIEFQERKEKIRPVYLKTDVLLLLFYCGEDTHIQDAERIFGEIQNQLEGEKGIMTFLAAGSGIQPYEELPESYRRMNHLLRYRITMGYGRCVSEESILKSNRKDVSVDLGFLRKKILEKDQDSALQYLEELFISLAESDIDIVYQNALKVILLLQDIKSEYKIKDSKAVRSLSEIFEHIYQAEDIPGMRTILVLEISGVIMALHTEDSHYTPVIKEILSYIQENYREDLSLKILSYKHHMNTSYLGQVFQKEVGCSFSQYLSNIKNEKAKDMILNTNMKINDIAREVGYLDASYFYRKFKQCYGVSPASLRGMKKY